MIKFFKNIRKSIVDSGVGGNIQRPVSKYLLYAVGEIFLVMIGILLALQVNTWNQAKMNRAQERLYLNSFLVDLKTDSLCIERNIGFLHNQKMPGLEIIGRLLINQEPCCQDSVKWAVENSAYLGWALNDERSTATFEEILSSGNITLIRNPELRTRIVVYYTSWEHFYDRVEKRKSNYPNLTYKLFDLEAYAEDIDWFHKQLKQNKAESEFRMEFKHEVKYAEFLEINFPYVKASVNDLKTAIQMELESR